MKHFKTAQLIFLGVFTKKERKKTTIKKGKLVTGCFMNKRERERVIGYLRKLRKRDILC